jgi:hypothetical protein
MRSGGRKTNRRWQCSRRRHGFHRHRRHNAAHQSPPGPQKLSHAKALQRRRRGLPSEPERDLALKRQVQAATQASASGPTSQNADPFCAAMYWHETCDSLAGGLRATLHVSAKSALTWIKPPIVGLMVIECTCQISARRRSLGLRNAIPFALIRPGSHPSTADRVGTVCYAVCPRRSANENRRLVG